MTVVVLLGAPGSGKGTQAPIVARHLGVPILASGDLLRAAVSAGTQLGRDADRFMSRGQLVERSIYIDVPTEDLISRMANRRICTANGHVYNLASNPPLRSGVCDVDGSEIIQRPDDQEATVRARMTEQIPPLLEVVDHYRRAGNLRTVDGRDPIDVVSGGVIAALEGLPSDSSSGVGRVG